MQKNSNVCPTSLVSSSYRMLA